MVELGKLEFDGHYEQAIPWSTIILYKAEFPIPNVQVMGMGIITKIKDFLYNIQC